MMLPMPLRRRGVQAVGRLDVDTTGLLLLSLWLVVRPRTPLSVDAALRGPERYEDVEEEAEH